MAQPISDAEQEIMKIIWANKEPTLFAFIMDTLAAEGKTWQKNTVITLLSRLMEKGYLKAKKLGRRNEYTALVSQTEYQTVQTQNFLTKVYAGNVNGLVANLVQNDLLSEAEYAELKRLLERGGPSDE